MANQNLGAGIDPAILAAMSGKIAAPNWALQIPGSRGDVLAQFGQGAGAPDVAGQNQAANMAADQDAAAAAAAGGIQAQKDAEGADGLGDAAARAAAGGVQAQKDQSAVDAMADRYRLAPKKETIDRQFKTADAIRKMGASLNTGSTNGAAPNWAGALASIAGAYMGKREQDKADAAAAGLGDQYAGIASRYFNDAPKSYF